jgi:SAM-dependent methyltransferase
MEKSPAQKAALSILRDSWAAMTPERAGEYLKTYGAPSERSKELLLELLTERAARAQGPLRLLDLGCGNAHLYEYFRDGGLDCNYTGVDFSEPLLAAARAAVGDDPRAHFVRSDVDTLEEVDGTFDIAIYSHVIEMLSSPESSLLAAKKVALSIAIRFFEPPEADVDTVELREMEIGDGTSVPYLRRTMSRDYYRLILSKLGCKRVDVYQDETAKDQIHLLHY